MYVRSFADSDGDGVGDLPGLLGRLDHLAWLGVDALWLSPVMPSPNADWGYDVADYCAVLPEYGTLDDLDEVIAAAGRARHPGAARPRPQPHQRPARVVRRVAFVGRRANARLVRVGRPQARRLRAQQLGGLLRWPGVDPRPGTGQYYLHNFLPEQPDLNWWCDEVRDAFDDIVRFWWDRGVAGFRIDVCNMMIKDAELRDNPPATEDDPFIMQMFGQRPLYNGNRPEAHDVLRRWRAIAEDYAPPRVLLGETNVDTLENLASFYGSGDDELHMGFNFPFIEAPFEAAALSDIVARTEALLPRSALAGVDGLEPRRVAPGHPVVRRRPRQGAPGPAHAPHPAGHARALPGRRDRPHRPRLRQGRAARPGRAAVLAVLPGPRPRAHAHAVGPRPQRRLHLGGGDAVDAPWPTRPMNVADQRADPASVLHFVRDAIALRRRSPELLDGDYQPAPVHDGLWAWRRGGTLVALNFSAATHDIDVGDTPTKTVALSTHRASEGPVVGGTLELDALQGVVVTTRA